VTVQPAGDCLKGASTRGLPGITVESAPSFALPPGGSARAPCSATPPAWAVRSPEPPLSEVRGSGEPSPKLTRAPPTLAAKAAGLPSVATYERAKFVMDDAEEPKAVSNWSSVAPSVSVLEPISILSAANGDKTR